MSGLNTGKNEVCHDRGWATCGRHKCRDFSFIL